MLLFLTRWKRAKRLNGETKWKIEKSLRSRISPNVRK
jgi:hypothetical protein